MAYQINQGSYVHLVEAIPVNVGEDKYFQVKFLTRWDGAKNPGSWRCKHEMFLTVDEMDSLIATLQQQMSKVKGSMYESSPDFI